MPHLVVTYNWTLHPPEEFAQHRLLSTTVRVEPEAAIGGPRVLTAVRFGPFAQTL